MKTRIFLTMLFMCLCSLVMAQQYDYTLHFDSYQFADRGQTKLDSIHSPATVHIDRSGTIRFDLTGKGTYYFRFSEVDYQSDTFFLLMWWDVVRFKNGDDRVLFFDDGLINASNISSLPKITLKSQDASKKFTAICELVKDKTFMVKRQQQQASNNYGAGRAGGNVSTGSVTPATGQSMICIYDGGYFIRDGQQWYEYRPKDNPTGVWASYTQYGDEANFYNIKSTAASVSVPKSTVNQVYMYSDGAWKVVYNTRQIFNFCPMRGNKLFCHNTGFFFKDGDRWTEYLPDKNSTSSWATYNQTGLDADFYYLKNSKCELAVPRKTVNKFFIKLPPDTSWKEVYTTTQIFDY